VLARPNLIAAGRKLVTWAGPWDGQPSATSPSSVQSSSRLDSQPAPEPDVPAIASAAAARAVPAPTYVAPGSQRSAGPLLRVPGIRALPESPPNNTAKPRAFPLLI
jgi:hypothetical protein